jgi:hypothetical protein
MADSTLADVGLAGTWEDLVVTHASLASAQATICNVGRDAVAIVFGGADPSAAGKSGLILGPRQSTQGNAAAVWARSLGADGTVSVTLADTSGTDNVVRGAIADNAANTLANAPVPIGAEVASAPPTYVAADIGTLRMCTRGRLWTTIGAPDSGASVVDANGVYAVPKPVTAGGLSLARVVTGTTGVIKASAGQLYSLSVQNTNAGVRYLHLYNKATAPTLSTDTPVMTIALLASSVVHLPLSDMGVQFTTGIAWAYTTDDVAIPTTAGTTAECHFTAGYK